MTVWVHMTKCAVTGIVEGRKSTCLSAVRSSLNVSELFFERISEPHYIVDKKEKFRYILR